MTKEELLKEIDIENRPSWSRKGQHVFNYMDKVYGVARSVQFIDGVDCFYNDDEIDNFLDKCLNRINNGTTRN